MPTATVERKLSHKQAAFVDAYLLNSNATQAAKLAGYSERSAGETGTELLHKPHVLAVINAKRCEITNESKVTVAWVLAMLVESATVCLKTMKIRDKDGISTGDVKLVDSAGGHKALELLGKHLGMFVERVEVDATINVSNPALQAFSVDELRALSDKLAIEVPVVEAEIKEIL